MVGFECDGLDDGPFDALLHRLVARELQGLLAGRGFSGHVSRLVDALLQLAQELRGPLGALTHKPFMEDNNEDDYFFEVVVIVISVL